MSTDTSTDARPPPAAEAETRPGELLPADDFVMPGPSIWDRVRKQLGLGRRAPMQAPGDAAALAREASRMEDA